MEWKNAVDKTFGYRNREAGTFMGKCFGQNSGVICKRENDSIVLFLVLVSGVGINP